MTSREEVEGTLARWFAVDADSHIGVFSGAYAAWPTAVFDDYAAVSAADDLLADAAPYTNPIASPAYAASCKLPSVPLDFRTTDLGPVGSLREAACGLFSFDARLGHGGSTIYYLDASPAQPVRFADAPSVLQRAARLVQFASLRFAGLAQLDLAHLVPFVVGRG
jgi:hypothetical protein